MNSNFDSPVAEDGVADAGEIARRVQAVRERMAAAAHRAGRVPAEVTLIAASKTWGAAAAAAAYRAGVAVLGENRVEEAVPKAAAVAELLAPDDPPVWHMIGHLQSRKARAALPWATMVHSVDSAKLARRLHEASAELDQVLEILLEVNVSGEPSKYGLAPEDVPPAVEAIAELPALRLVGLMTMAPMVDDGELARPYFHALRELRDQLARRYPQASWQHLSMGMTDDFEVAIEEGATLVRIGRAIFGQRYCAIR